jgi:hypothetical protein
MITFRLRYFKTNPEFPVPPERQLEIYTTLIEGTAKTWQVVREGPGIHILYFEVNESMDDIQLAKGYEKRLREEMIGVKQTKINKVKVKEK